MSDIKKPIMIKISPTGLDDLFIMKHMYEAENGIQNHIVYDEFLYKTIGLGEWSFYHGRTQSAVPFAVVTVKNMTYIVYASSGNNECDAAFLDALSNCSYNIDSLSEIDVLEFSKNTQRDFFNIKGKMMA